MQNRRYYAYFKKHKHKSKLTIRVKITDYVDKKDEEKRKNVKKIVHCKMIINIQSNNNDRDKIINMFLK